MKKYKYNIEDYKFYRFRSCNYLTSFYASDLRTPLPEGCTLDWYSKRNICLHRGDYDLPGLEFPIVFKEHIDSGKKFPDILDNRYSFAYHFSDRFLEALNAEGITGWKTYPVQIFDKKGNEIKGYNGLSVIGRCGEVGFQEYDANGEGILTSWGFDLDTWDGSDMFVSSNHGCYYVTSKFIQMLVKYKLGSCEYLPLVYGAWDMPFEERRRWTKLIR